MSVESSTAQFRLVNSHPVFGEGQRGNLFVQWEGLEPLSAANVQLPPGWRLVDVALLQRGRRETVSWVSDPQDAAVRIAPASPISGAARLVLKVEAPGFPSVGGLTLAPVPVEGEDAGAVSSGHLGLRDELATEPTQIDRSNRVAVFRGRSRIEVRGRDLPLYSGDRSYTLELWFKSTGLGEVMMSAWDGDESAAYPVELVVAPDGRLQYFRGEPGRHLSMSTARPVADGRWHHLAVVHDEVRGWTRMLIDSSPTDSLFGHTDAAAMGSERRLCLGGRCESEARASESRSAGYSGHMDDVRLWPTARTVRQITASMGDRLPRIGGMIALGFDEPLSREFDVRGDRVSLEPSDFLFYDPVEGLSASLEGDDVQLEWHCLGRNTVSFVVERSLDGVEFNEVGREKRERDNAYSFTDEATPDGVIYYRIQQQLANGGSRVSGTLKVGAGEELPSAVSSMIIGNFPNPFSTRTTVRYQVFEPERVTVSVWDLSGHQVALLADGQAASGVHEVSFDAGDLPSGTYFVRLQTEEGVSTRSLTLMR